MHRIEEFERNVSSLTKDLEGLSDDLREARRNEQKLKRELNDSQTERESLQTSIITIGNAKEKLEQQVHEMHDKCSQLESLRQENYELQRLVDDVQEQRKAWTEEIRDALSKSADHENMFRGFEEINNQLKEAQREAHKQIRELIVERDDLKRLSVVCYNRKSDMCGHH